MRTASVHRDIKPANVLIDGGHVVVADFGVAKAIAAARGEWDRAEQTDGAHEVSSSLTVVGSAIGTPAYMSPEQARAEEVDARTDVYSLGCMAFEMLTGQLPFGSAGVYGIADPEVEPPPAASTHCPGLPPAVDGVLARALAHNVDARFQSTTALAEALGAVAAQAAGTDGGATALPGSAWRPRWVAAAALAGAAVIVAGGVALRRVWTASPSAAAGSTAAANASRSGAVTAPDGGPKLAVLPFENLGPQEDAYFAQGVGDGLASRLTSVAGVRVISPASTRQYRNTTKPAVQVGRELGVEYLLGGRVRWDRADQGPRRMRVTVELVRASDGRSCGPTATTPRPTVCLPWRVPIGERVTRALAVALGARERQTISTRPTTSFEAYTYFLRGEALRTDWVDEYKAKINAVTLYERAVSLDPKFALAFARLAETHGNIYWASVDRTAKRLTLMRDAAETAVRLDPDLAEGHLALGYYYYRAQRDYDRALREFAAGLERQPGRA
jgi:serine/threonine-protein kinase